MGVDIPTEILLHISHYIPDSCLREMLAVNRLFYNIVMDLWYRDVVIATVGADTMKSVVKLRYPEVARRIRRLKVHLSLMELEGKHQDMGSAGSTQVVKRGFNNVLRRVLATWASSPSHGRGRSPSCWKDPFATVIAELSAAFPAMINVQELSIDSWDLPPQYNLHPFLASMWSSFSRNLHTFSLEGNLEDYRVLINSNPPFESLKHLRVDMDNTSRIDVEADRSILVNTVAPFINRLGPQLVSMRVWSWGSLELSAFFMNIGPFPKLECLNIRTAFDKAFREDPVGLQWMLCEASSTLHRINLHLSPTGSTIDPALEGRLGRWLLQCLEDKRCFAGARALDIYPTNLPVGMDFLLRTIQRAAEHLTELILRDHYLNAEEIDVLLGGLVTCKNLTCSRLGVCKMNVALFDAMAIKAPSLRRLWLSVGRMVACDRESFKNEIRHRSFPEWKIKDLTIWQSGAEVDGDITMALAHSIPSVNRF